MNPIEPSGTHDDLADLDAIARRFEAQPSALAAPAPAAPATDPADRGRLLQMQRLAGLLAQPLDPELTGRAMFAAMNERERWNDELSRLRCNEPAPYTPSDWSKRLGAARRGPSGW